MLTGKEAQALLVLIEQGECPNSQSLEILQPLALWHLAKDLKTLIASQVLLTLRQTLSSSQDAVAAILATETEYQNAWAKIIAAQLKDAGSRDDISALVEQISQLGAGTESILAQLETASLAPSPYSEVENLLFGQGAEQGASYPKLLRALATASAIRQLDEVSSCKLDVIDATNISNAWQANRLIELPTLVAEIIHSPYILSGVIAAPDFGFNKAGANTLEQSKESDSLSWLLQNPWGFLLAQVAYAQDVWRSEQIAGGLRLEIDPTQAKYFMQPGKVQVVVTTRDDLEVNCGSLGELLLRVFATLNIHLFTPLPAKQQAARLDALIAPLIGYMVEAKVWQFIQGSSKDIPHYQIHPQFERIPSCRVGTIHFARPGKYITAAIREQAERWAIELSGRQSQSHSLQPLKTANAMAGLVS